jgi:hypothetical protein
MNGLKVSHPELQNANIQIRSHFGSSYGRLCLVLQVSHCGRRAAMAAYEVTAADLLIGLHGRLLRMAAASTGRHFTGLGTMARLLKLPGGLAKKLARLDAATAFIRHATIPDSENFFQDVRLALANCDRCQSPCRASQVLGMDGVAGQTHTMEPELNLASSSCSRSRDCDDSSPCGDGDSDKQLVGGAAEYDINQPCSDACTQTATTGLNMLLLQSLPELGDWMEKSCYTDAGFRSTLLHVASLFEDQYKFPGGSLTDSPPALESGACTAGSGKGGKVLSQTTSLEDDDVCDVVEKFCSQLCGECSVLGIDSCVSAVHEHGGAALVPSADGVGGSDHFDSQVPLNSADVISRTPSSSVAVFACPVLGIDPIVSAALENGSENSRSPSSSADVVVLPVGSAVGKAASETVHDSDLENGARGPGDGVGDKKFQDDEWSTGWGLPSRLGPPPDGAPPDFPLLGNGPAATVGLPGEEPPALLECSQASAGRGDYIPFEARSFVDRKIEEDYERLLNYQDLHPTVPFVARRGKATAPAPRRRRRENSLIAYRLLDCPNVAASGFVQSRFEISATAATVATCVPVVGPVISKPLVLASDAPVVLASDSEEELCEFCSRCRGSIYFYHMLEDKFHCGSCHARCACDCMRCFQPD